MHFLTRQRLHLSRFHPLMKALLTLYILSVAAAVWVAALKYADRGAFSAEGLSLYVQGTGEATDDPFGDPLAGTPEGLVRSEGLSRRQLIDIVHPHLFTVPIVLFILGHLLHLTRLPDVLKLTVNAGTFLAFLATFLLPLLMLRHPLLGTLLLVSGTAMTVGFGLLCVIPLYEMWLGRPGRGFDALPRQGP